MLEVHSQDSDIQVKEAPGKGICEGNPAETVWSPKLKITQVKGPGGQPPLTPCWARKAKPFTVRTVPPCKWTRRVGENGGYLSITTTAGHHADMSAKPHLPLVDLERIQAGLQVSKREKVHPARLKLLLGGPGSGIIKLPRRTTGRRDFVPHVGASGSGRDYSSHGIDHWRCCHFVHEGEALPHQASGGRWGRAAANPDLHRDWGAPAAGAGVGSPTQTLVSVEFHNVTGRLPTQHPKPSVPAEPSS